MIDNKFRTRYTKEIKKGLYVSNSLELKNPFLFPNTWELAITNGLGYQPVRKQTHEDKSDTPAGLLRHLGNMDLVCLNNKLIMLYAISFEHFRAFIATQHQYINFINELDQDSKKIIELIQERLNETTDRICREINKNYSAPENILNEPQQSPESKEPFYKRFFRTLREYIINPLHSDF